MEQEKYRMTVISVGSMAAELFEDGLLIFFGASAPGELQEVSIMHNSTELTADVKKGDVIVLGEEKYEVLVVGPVANENIRNLGHVVIKFNGLDIAENPGDINVRKSSVPTISSGMEIAIYGG